MSMPGHGHGLWCHACPGLRLHGASMDHALTPWALPWGTPRPETEFHHLTPGYLSTQQMFIAGTHHPQGHLHLRSVFEPCMRLPWKDGGFAGSTLEGLQRKRAAYLSGTLVLCVFPFSLNAAWSEAQWSILLYSAPEPLQEKWKHKGLQRVLQLHTENRT